MNAESAPPEPLQPQPIVLQANLPFKPMPLETYAAIEAMLALHPTRKHETISSYELDD